MTLFDCTKKGQEVTRVRYSVTFFAIFIILFSVVVPCTYTSPVETSRETVEFRIFTTGGKPVQNGEVIVINRAGNVIATGNSNKQGTVRISLPVQHDPRFLGQKSKLDTVTVLVVADGYNENVLFEVPVTKDSVQPVAMQAVNRNRNEPTFGLGNISRFSVFDLVDFYAKLGLKRQTPRFSDDTYSPWGPRTE